MVYKFIHTGFPKYFAPHLSTYHTIYNTRRSQRVANFVNVTKCQPTIHKSTKQFGFSFAFHAPAVWNSLTENIRPSRTIASFRKKLLLLLYCCALESTTQWRLSAIKVELDLELYKLKQVQNLITYTYSFKG